jgi:aminopeptidase N
VAHPALTRDEAAARAALLDVSSYDIDLDLTSTSTTFRSVTTVQFTSRTPGAQTWIDLVAPHVIAATLNGEKLDVSGHNGQRLAIPGLADQNTLVVEADCAFSRTGEGLHRLVDPVDEETYLYTQFETADAQRVFACFDQPDLKAVFTWHVTAPAHWHVVSNTTTPEPTPVGQDVARWDFPTTEQMPTYINALVAGPFHVVRDEYAGAHGTYPMGIFCRTSMAPYLDAERIFTETKQGFAFFEDAFGYPYPFGKYDQLFVPEYNAGAMENAGCVTIVEDLIFRSRVTDVAYEQRANTILHELAHMWFGDLVTMRWWDDLWLNESFAEWASHHAMIEATSYIHAWTTFGNLRKTWAYRQDQLPSTHPIATDMTDLEAVKLNFDGITYAKGASALRQLVAWVGEKEFFAGLRTYFAKHQWSNSVLSDLLVELEATSGRDLTEWTEQWLRTSGVTLLHPEVTVAEDGTYASVAIRQEPPSAPAGLPPVLRHHRLRVGRYDLRDGVLIRTGQIELDVTGACTEVPQLTGQPAADLLLVNDDDLTYAKVRLDERSLATVADHFGALHEPMPRSLIWGSVWDMTRDAEMSTGAYLTMVLSGVASEGDVGLVQKALLQARTAIDLYAAPEHRADYAQRLAAGVHELLLAAQPGSGHQLALARALIGSAVSDEQLDLIGGLLDGSSSLEGLVIDTDLRWSLLGRLVSSGRASEVEIAAELQRDDTATGRRSATALRASIPTAEAKSAAWDAVVSDSELPNALLSATLGGFSIGQQRELYRPYRERYFEAVEQIWASRSAEMASMIASGLFPYLQVEPETVAQAQAFLERPGLAAGLRRVVGEGRDGVERALRCQAADAPRRPTQAWRARHD